ncbi:DDE domain-containing protein [Priestia megaterium]|nr:DDE domain-containing protein [Priestia megaterium]
MYLYRAIDPEENTIDLYLNKRRNHKAAKRFFKKALCSFHVSKSRIITVDKNPAYPVAIEELKKEKKVPVGIQIRKVKYLNNIVEQDHRFIKKRVRTAKSILSRIEAMHIIKKGQVCPKSREVHSSTVWISCMSTNSTSNLYTCFSRM